MALATENDQAVAQNPLSKFKALVVHGDAALLVYYRYILELLGFEVLTASSDGAGLAALERESFGFIILSEGNRAFEGRSILERATRNDRHIPVLVVARQRDSNKHHEAVQMGAVGYLEDPATVGEMERLVTAHLGSPSSAA